MILPPTLEPGDRVALVAPAGPVDETAIETAIARCRHLGLEPVPGDAVRGRTGYLAGLDRDRAADLEAAIAGDVQAIWALRGGYGTLRTLDHVDLTPLRERPRAFIGFSDNTAVHAALLRLGIVGFHGPHAGYPHFPRTTEQSFRAVLMEADPAGALPLPGNAAPRAIVGGTAEGRLVGGNLAMLAAVCGTRYQLDPRGAILFLEDVSEPPYRVDRMITQLRLAGVLDEVVGVALGDFTPPDPPAGGGDAPGDSAPTEADILAVLAELLEPLGVPVVCGLPFGHGRENWTLPVGVRARLDADAPALEIVEAATRREARA